MLIKRRNILGSLGGLAVAPLFSQGLAAAETKNDLIVVTIMLYGGNDGLNMVVPLPQYGEYYKLRTPATPPQGLNMAYALSDLQYLAFDSNPTTPPLQCNEYAFAPGMDAMHALYANGNLAVINGISLPLAETNSLSHYNAQIDWLTGQININDVLPYGWLGLALEGVAGGSIGAVASLGGTSQELITSSGQGIVINPPMDYFGVNYGVTDKYTLLKSSYQQIAALPALSASGLGDQRIMQEALADIAAVRAIAKKEKAKTYALNTYLDYQLRDIGRLIVGGAGVRGYFAQTGGFDTHGQQALYQPLLLQQLGESLASFYEYLLSENATSNVLVITMSDFGRRPQANLDFGTDHGAASTAFAFGDPVKGGVYGTYPSLKSFDVNGNLKLSIDFRSLLSDVITGMGGNPVPILGTFPTIGFL